MTVYNLSTGETVQYPLYQACSLVYCDTDFETFNAPQNSDLKVEFYRISGITNILSHYIQQLTGNGTHSYSHFFVLYNNVCNVYIPGNKFMLEYDIADELEYDNRLDFWILKLKYHRDMLPYAIMRFSCDELASVEDVIDIDNIESFKYVDIFNAISIEDNMIGFDTWECADTSQCHKLHN